MKILLTLYLCSTVAGTCLDGFEWPETYNDMYDCMITGYNTSIEKMVEIGRLEVNKYDMFIKFTCMEQKTILRHIQPIKLPLPSFIMCRFNVST